MAARHRAASVVRWHGLVAPKDAVAAGRNAAAQLFFDWIDPDAEGVLTGKLFEYLHNGRPIAFIGSGKETEAAAVARRSGAAILLQTDEAIEQFLVDWPARLPASPATKPSSRRCPAGDRHSC